MKANSYSPQQRTKSKYFEETSHQLAKIKCTIGWNFGRVKRTIYQCLSIKQTISTKHLHHLKDVLFKLSIRLKILQANGLKRETHQWYVLLTFFALNLPLFFFFCGWVGVDKRLYYIDCTKEVQIHDNKKIRHSSSVYFTWGMFGNHCVITMTGHHVHWNYQLFIDKICPPFTNFSYSRGGPLGDIQ